MVEPSDPAGHRPPHLEENIDSVLEVQKREWEQRPRSQRIVERFSGYIGRPRYLALLMSFVVAWIVFNSLAPHWGASAFDPFPYPLLDGILTLAALFSTTIVLIAQNRQTRQEQQHTHIALQLNLATEQKVAKIIKLIEELRRDLPMVRNRYDPQAERFAEKTDALQVLSAIEEVGLIDHPAAAAATPAADAPRK
ncbi:MAG TPA: DUF1003 domain-containing protein [Steroidobacteraceae bacterium]|nr:DUF1003 domain-containing protein [Steroidobacteraceae bacterium]